MVTDRDPTAHAEMQAIRDAARRLGTNDLSGVRDVRDVAGVPDVRSRRLLGADRQNVLRHFRPPMRARRGCRSPGRSSAARARASHHGREPIRRVLASVDCARLTAQSWRLGILFVFRGRSVMILRLRHLPFVVALALFGAAQAPRHGFAIRSARQGVLPDELQPQGAGAVRARRGDAALVLVLGGREGLPRRAARTIPQCAIATWGIASILMSNPLAGQGASPKGAEQAQAAIDAGPPHRRQDASASATTSRPSPPTTRTSRTRSERERQAARAKAYEALARTLPERRRGADLLRALHRRHAVAGRPDLRRVPQGGRDPREAVRRSIPTIPAWRTT